MPKLIDLSIVIPTYLERENLEFILPRLNDCLNRTKLQYEILVVDTMTPMDATPQVCDKYKATYINRVNSNNYGDAIRTAIKMASGNKIVFMDADGSHDPEFISELLKYQHSHDVVIASRYVKGGGIENSKPLIFMSKFLNLTYSLILNINCKDLSNSYKLYSGTQLKNLTLYCKNFDIVEEIIYKLTQNNKQLKIIELPYVFKRRVHGHTKRNLLVFICSYFYTILRLRFGK